jgi:hypothetical protein
LTFIGRLLFTAERIIGALSTIPEKTASAPTGCKIRVVSDYTERADVLLPEPTPAEKRMFASYMAHKSWANTEDRTARTSNARAGLEKKWLIEAKGDPVRAASLRAAHYKLMAARSAESRRRARGAA